MTHTNKQPRKRTSTFSPNIKHAKRPKTMEMKPLGRSQALSPRQRAILNYLIGKNWITPTEIGQAIWGNRHKTHRALGKTPRAHCRRNLPKTQLVVPQIKKTAKIIPACLPLDSSSDLLQLLSMGAATNTTGGQNPRLEIAAKNAVWWKPAAEVLANTDDFLCRVMAANIWDDITYIDSIFGEDALRHALRHAPAGIFAPATWHYWHYRLGYKQVPELPTRKFA